MEIISRKEAKAKGLKKYFTGKPCKHGHVAERHVSGCCCVCNVLAADNWKKANPEKRRAVAAKWQKNNPEKVRAAAVARYKANPEKRRERNAAWHNANPEKLRAARRKLNYNLLPEDFDALMALQDHSCAYCSRPLIDGATAYEDRPCVDHDHATDEVRMILCHRCNIAYGRLGDNIAGLKRALSLLEDTPYSRMKLAHKLTQDQPLTDIRG